MPELPEVETIRRQLAPLLTGRSVREAWGHASPKFAAAPEIVGSTISGVSRRGKYLLVELGDGRQLVLHLGMTGRVDVASGANPVEDDPYVRAWWAFTDGALLVFNDVRRFGRLAVVRAGEYEGIPTLHAMGPEPLSPDFDGRVLWERVRQSSQRIKTQLLSQRPVAGVGNIYADEALFLAGINPAVRRLSPARATDLAATIRAVLSAGIERGGTTLRDYRSLEGAGSNQFHLQCYGRGGLPCLRCGVVLRSRVIDGRTTTSCPSCQT